METTLRLSPAVAAYALESGIPITPNTNAGVWGYYIATVPAYAPGAWPRIEGPYNGIAAIHAVANFLNDDDVVVTDIIARFPAGTEYAYTL